MRNSVRDYEFKQTIYRWLGEWLLESVPDLKSKGFTPDCLVEAWVPKRQAGLQSGIYFSYKIDGVSHEGRLEMKQELVDLFITLSRKVFSQTSEMDQ